MIEKDRVQGIGITYAVMGTMLFSLKSIFIKLLYLEGLSADDVLVLRMAIALPIYVAIFMYCMHDATVRSRFALRPVMLTVLAGMMGYYLASLLDLLGLELISAQLERLALFSYPCFVAVIATLVFKAPLTRRLLIGFVVSYSGLALVMFQEGMLLGNHVGLGVSLVLGSAFVFAIYLTMSHALIGHFGSLLFTSLAMMVSSAMVFLHGYMTIDVMSLHVSHQAWLWLLLLAILSTVIPSFLISDAIGRIGPSRASAIGLLGPVFTVLFAVQFLNEPFTVMTALGGGLVLAGVGSIQFSRSKAVTA